MGIPDLEPFIALARRLDRGVVVALGQGDAVYEARKATREFDNVMIVPGTPDELPWRDGYFTRVIDTVRDWPDAGKVRSEVARVTQGAANG